MPVEVCLVVDVVINIINQFEMNLSVSSCEKKENLEMI